MPNRTIYVADADLPVFEKAQQLAGDNLSGTITAALKRFVEAEESRARGFEEITLKVGKIAPTYKRFRGRLLAKGRVLDQNDVRVTMYRIFQTQKSQLALYIRSMPNWTKWSNQDWSYKNKSHQDWSQWPNDESRLEVYQTLDELKNNVPTELYEAVAQALKGDPDGIEFLDI